MKLCLTLKSTISPLDYTATRPLSTTVGYFHLQILDSVWQIHPHSTNSKSNIIWGRGGSYVSTDMYHVVRPTMTVSVVNITDLFFSCHYSLINCLHGIYILLGIISNLALKYMRGYA